MERDGLFGRPYGHAGDLLQMHRRAAAPEKGSPKSLRGKPMKLAFTRRSKPTFLFALVGLLPD